MKALLTASSYSGVGGNIIDSSIGLEHGNKGGTKVPFCGENIVKSSYPNIILIEEDEHELAKEDMTKVRDENTKLKRMLEQLGRDYQSLHKRFIDIKQPQQFNKTIAQQEDHDREERELLSLRLGRNHSKPQRDNQVAQTRDDNNLQLLNNEGLYLASDDSNENSSVVETGKEDEGDQAGEISPPYKLLKTMRSSGNDEEATLQQPVTKRARVSVRAKCDSSTINDGCQWRKYGQKTAKGNPCPRAYYRCTIAPGCPVKKQVQRCMHDMAILTTTYEGTHNHPLPASATSMASTTSAAASMLLSGSSTSAMSPSFFQGQNFGIDNTNLSPTSLFYLPNTSPQAFSTITLDLTTSRFSSSRTNNLPSVWGNGYLNNVAMPYNKTTLIPQFFPSPNSEKSKQVSSQQILTETLTRAITSDPSLRSVINAAISSMVINSGENKNNSQQAPLQFSI